MGAANASEAPLACTRTTISPSGQPSVARASRTLRHQRSSAASPNASPRTVSSAAPVPAK